VSTLTGDITVQTGDSAMTDPYRPNPGGPPPDDPYGFGTAAPPQNYPYDYGYGSPYAHPGHPAQPPTDGMAIASLVVSCVSVLGLCASGIGGLFGLVGAILGHVSRRRIRNTGAGGSGLALAGIIVGWSIVAITALLAAAVITLIVVSENNNA
jgi:hypothetical protein